MFITHFVVTGSRRSFCNKTYISLLLKGFTSFNIMEGLLYTLYLWEVNLWILSPVFILSVVQGLQWFLGKFNLSRGLP